MNRRILVLAVVIICAAVGCNYGPHSVLDPPDPKPESFVPTLAAENARLDKTHDDLRKSVEKVSPPKINVKPVMPAYDPLEDRTVSFSMVNEDLQVVLYTLSQSVGMNLIVDPGINVAKNSLTINFDNVPASLVLKEILNSFDLYYEIEGNVIRVKQFKEHIFTLNFLDTATDTDFVVGGDVLGAAGEESAVIGLSGSFKLTGKGHAKGKGNAYDVIEAILKGMLSDGGRYTLNRMSGTLFVKDSPENIRAVARMVNHAKEMLGRQILIEARIIEVALNKEHDYGIDWQVFKTRTNSDGDNFTDISWVLETGLAIQGLKGDIEFSATIDALNTFGEAKVVSNPIIRTKHSKPAMISVGTSISYVESTETTTIGAGDTATTTTEVDVSKVFDGLILGVIPFIEKDGRITLMINPIQSEVDRSSLELVDVGNVSITLPEVTIFEMSSSLALQNGDTIILGGLIDNRKFIDDEGYPLLSAIPLFGYLFRSEFSSDRNLELVIILSVNIV